MSAVTITGEVSTSTLNPDPNIQATKTAYEDIPLGRMCYVKSDDTFALATGAAANAAALPFGISVRAAKAGQPVTVRHACQFGAVTGQSPGARLYLGTAGGFDTAATTGGTVPIAIVMDASNIYVLPPTR